MKSYYVKRYQPEDSSLWNDFVAQAKNATFLFHRDFMDYHKDRFEDYSLLIFDSKQVLKAILPANRVGDTLFSHQGLTYGGLVVDQNSKLSDLIQIVQYILKFLFENKIIKLELKMIPTIYTLFPSEELEYIVFLLNAFLLRRDILTVLEIKNHPSFSKLRSRGIEKGKKNGLRVQSDANLDSFWNTLLVPNLKERHNAKPVHSLEEIKLLHAKFPRNIRQFNVYFNNELVAGTTIFESEHVAHCQYIAGSSKYNHLGGLDFLHHHLIKNVFTTKKYFDFGTSNENQGKNINAGLLFWKESFGARTVVQNFYTIETKNYINLENVLL